MQNDNEINMINTVDEKTLKKRLLDTRKKVNKERKNKKKLRIILVSIICSIILLIVSIVIFLYYRNLNKYQLTTEENHNLYQYFQGVKVEYKGKLTIKKNNDEIKLSQDVGIENIEDAPIYFSEVDNQVFFAKNMSLIIPRIKNQSYRINYFSKIICENDTNQDMAYLVNKYDKKVYLEESFLYDGDNLYFFIYDTSVVVDGKKYDLDALSYVIVNYKGQIEIYDKTNDKYTIIDEHNNDVIATIGNYSINLSTDVLMYKDDSRLLIKNIDNLPLYEDK